MIIMKFGGTSIADAEAIRRVTEIIRKRLSLKPIVVNSAMGKTTRNLLDIAHLSASREAHRAEEKLEEIRAYHSDLIHAVLDKSEESDSMKRLTAYHSELQKLLHGMAVLQDLTPRSLDKFLSYGERIATAIIAEHLRQNDIEAVLTDARTFMITDDRFGQASLLDSIAEEKIRQSLIPLVEGGKVPVVQGYIGATESGATTTLGFEGSDFTATFIGASVEADDIQIWKDVPGIMTADPAFFPGAKTIKRISFDAAAELTFFGAKVLHPRAVAPAKMMGIPVHVYNSRNPDASGTEITGETYSCANVIQSIAYKRAMCRMQAVSNHLLKSNEFLKNIHDVLDREGIEPYLITTAGSSVSIALENGDSIAHIRNDLARFADVTLEEGKATVSLVGESLRNRGDAPFEILRLIDGLPVHMMVHEASPINVTLLVNESDLEDVITRFHAHFFKKLDPNIFEV